MESIDKKLVNFRCDMDVLDRFDETCNFKRTNRTHILTNFMRNSVGAENEEIDRWKLLSDSMIKPS